MNSKFGLFVGRFTILITSLFTVPYIIKNAQANQQVCNRNPGEEQNTSTIRSNSAKVQGYVLKVQLRYNNKTKQKWSRACIPAGTQLYLKDKTGRIYGSYFAQING
jgi:hypothetical protein